MPGTLFFSKHWNWPVFSLSLPDIFQDQGSKYSLRVSSGSLYRVSPVKIPSKCYGRSNLLETLHARSTLNLWQQKILGRITWRSCSSHLTSFVSSVSNIIIHFPFAFCYWKIMIKFTIFVVLRNILQNYSSKTCCKLNLLFLDITTMKWIHGNKAPESPDLPPASICFGTQLQLLLQPSSGIAQVYLEANTNNACLCCNFHF